MRLILGILLNGLLVYFASWLLPGVSVQGFGVAILTGIALALVNFFIKPVLTLLTLPITILTLGLFLLVINGAMVLLVDWLITGFDVQGWFWAIFFSIILALLNMIIGNLEGA
jgi:putative membrane protein